VLNLKKIRPAIIVNNNILRRLPLKIIVPITDWKERYSIAPWMVKIEIDGSELTPQQVRLIRSLNTMIAHVLLTENEDEYFEDEEEDDEDEDMPMGGQMKSQSQSQMKSQGQSQMKPQMKAQVQKEEGEKKLESFSSFLSRKRRW
jgi:mRNA-degrading endonuclease toxin of MazEF toxin-antitoxin module